MDCGEEFVKTYNKNIEDIITAAIVAFEKCYDTNKSFEKVEKIIAEPLIEEINTIENKQGTANNLFQTSHKYLEQKRTQYTYDITIAIVNDEIKNEIFDKREKSSEINNYLDYINYFARREAIRNYFKFTSKYSTDLDSKFKSKKMNEAFTLIKEKRETHTFKGFDKKKEVKKISTFNLTQNEKMILLHVLLHTFNKSELNKVSTEYFRVLALCSECLVETDLFQANTNFNKYKYFYQGAEASHQQPNPKTLLVDNILTKLEGIDNINKFKLALKRYKNLK